MKLPVVVIAALLSLTAVPALAADIYRCGNTYTDAPCGKKVQVFNDTPTCADQVSAATRFFENRLYILSREYGQREFELTKSYIGAARISQNTTVTTIGGGSSSNSGASGGDAHSTSNSSAGASASADRFNIDLRRR